MSTPTTPGRGVWSAEVDLLVSCAGCSGHFLIAWRPPQEFWFCQRCKALPAHKPKAGGTS